MNTEELASAAAGAPKKQIGRSLKPRKQKSVIEKIRTIKRLVHYYELLVGYRSNHAQVGQYPFEDLLQFLTEDIKKGVYIQHLYDGKTIFISDINFDKRLNIYQGKIFTIRTEDFPVLYNNITKITRDIEAGQDDGIAEVSHFLIDYKHNYPRVALEYNENGARINSSRIHICNA